MHGGISIDMTEEFTELQFKEIKMHAAAESPIFPQNHYFFFE